MSKWRKTDDVISFSDKGITVSLVSMSDKPMEGMGVAGSNCYDSVPSVKIVEHCKKVGHHSILEFGWVHFKIEGVSRAMTHQLVRHRLFSYAQRSQRYVKEDNFGYVTPPSIANKDTNYDYYMKQIQGWYDDLIKAGVPAEDARFILPNACETTIDMAGNMRNVVNFAGERCCARSQWEIQTVARLIKKCITEACPELGAYVVPKCMKNAPYRFCVEKEPCKGVPSLQDLFHGYSQYKLRGDE